MDDVKKPPHKSGSVNAVVLGASGSVGGALVQGLIQNGSFKSIVTLVRQSQPHHVEMARQAGVVNTG